ncbi:Uncharacterized protein TCM_001436 [Theobroma cacao]|uniref:Uncharacterized protein n=1 Tax=Theobroma cacao TaxID=3641 RepID=A0A061DIW5_THECC|nr:Uncharacterized protein TCM_001436 [Theobroma cacao]
MCIVAGFRICCCFVFLGACVLLCACDLFYVFLALTFNLPMHCLRSVIFEDFFLRGFFLMIFCNNKISFVLLLVRRTIKLTLL